MASSGNQGSSSGGIGVIELIKNHFKFAFNSSGFSKLQRFSTVPSSRNPDSHFHHEMGKNNGDLPLPIQLLPSSSTVQILDQRSSISMKQKIKETFKLENLKPILEDWMLSADDSTSSTLPTNTPISPKPVFPLNLSAINETLPKKLGDYKAFAIRALSGDEAFEHTEEHICEMEDGKNGDQKDEGSTCLSLSSLHSLHATGPDPYDKFKFRHDIASNESVSEVGVGHSTSLDSSDSDPHRKLWFRSESQLSLQSWVSSLSFDSQAEELNDVREFMLSFVDDVFKNVQEITVDRKAEFGKLAQTEQGRLWFARCINAKRCCKCVLETTFFSLIQHFAVMLFECAEADDFSPAKSLMNMCFTYYHEVASFEGTSEIKEFLYQYLRQQPIWKSLRFWNAAFFDALQCERCLRPISRLDHLEALEDEINYQQNITFGQLGTFTCNMHAFSLPKATVLEFLRKQVTIANLRDDQVKLLQENVDRMYSEKQEWA